jgi:hypothetical protein
MAIGLVPTTGLIPRVGATRGAEFDNAMPMKPEETARKAYQPAIPK